MVAVADSLAARLGLLHAGISQHLHCVCYIQVFVGYNLTTSGKNVYPPTLGSFIQHQDRGLVNLIRGIFMICHD